MALTAKEDRLVAANMLHYYGAETYGIINGMYKVAHRQRKGLTEKEYKFLMARYEALKGEMEKLTVLTRRLEHHGN